jgi:LmbE family N-acetylglucosaminyl deacetylase
MKMDNKRSKEVAVIVAHPDDETLWAGGTILSHPSWQWFIVCLCRKNDKERATKFFNALQALGAAGIMGDLDDGPEQTPLDENEVELAILQLLPSKHFDLIISHNPNGEYTKHIRHEEIGKAVITLWKTGKISTDELWTFAYEDGCGQYLPQPVKTDTLCHVLPEIIWQKKYHIINEIFGFEKNSWEAETTPKEESFLQFTCSADAVHWLAHRGKE